MTADSPGSDKGWTCPNCGKTATIAVVFRSEFHGQSLELCGACCELAEMAEEANLENSFCIWDDGEPYATDEE